MAGQITEGLDLIATYAFTDARITKDGSGNQGHRLPGVPEHSGRLWLKYDFPPASVLDGWSLGGGVYVVGDRQTDNENCFKLPEFARVDAFVGYRLKGPTARVTQFNVRNLLNKEYYDSSDQFSNSGLRESIFPGEPLTFIGSIRLEYW